MLEAMTFEEILTHLPKPYYADDAVAIFCADCRDILPLIPDRSIDLVLTDPPYGIGLDTTYSKFKNAKVYEPIIGDGETFDYSILWRLSDRFIIWGGNCFASCLPDFPGWLAWIKTGRNAARIRQAEMELAWTNFITRSQCFRFTWIGAWREGNFQPTLHPTMKPTQLMDWCLSLVPKANIILDPFLGSGTTAFCAKKLGRKCLGIEIEERYCAIAATRCSQTVMRLDTECPPITVPYARPGSPRVITIKPSDSYACKSEQSSRRLPCMARTC